MEIWLDIEGFENLYQVSNLGRVKSLQKIVNYIDGRNRKYKEIILKDRYDGKGYVRLCLHKGSNSYQIGVHRLVAKAFLENKEDKLCVNHKDSNRKNNKVDNLEWCTFSENTIHAYKMGRLQNPNKKISKQIVEEIRELWKKRELKQHQIAKLYNLGQAQISRIVNKQNWK